MTTKTHEALMRRKDIPDAEVGDIVAIAAKLQDDSRPTAPTASEADIKQVANELNIEDQFVEEAIAQWRSSKDTATVSQRRAKMRKNGFRILWGLGILVAVVGVAGALLFNAIAPLGPEVLAATAAIILALVLRALFS
ncbi:MAG: hypothetical protein ACPGTU_13255 [Myxococcota bacterium]